MSNHYITCVRCGYRIRSCDCNKNEISHLYEENIYDDCESIMREVISTHEEMKALHFALDTINGVIKCNAKDLDTSIQGFHTCIVEVTDRNRMTHDGEHQCHCGVQWGNKCAQ